MSKSLFLVKQKTFPNMMWGMRVTCEVHEYYIKTPVPGDAVHYITLLLLHLLLVSLLTS